MKPNDITLPADDQEANNAASAGSMTRLVRESRNEHTALYLLHAAAGLLEQIPANTGASSSVPRLIKEIRKAGKTCLRRMDRCDVGIANAKRIHPHSQKAHE